MNRTYLRKIGLGTAQFGQDYGIANKTGKISKADAYKILNYAAKSNIGIIDTASIYGESEEVIGGFIKENGGAFKVISKMPPFGENGLRDTEAVFSESLKRLNADAVYGYLFHCAGDFFKNESLWNGFLTLKRKGLVKKIGFSLYHPEDLKALFGKKVSFDMVQIPYSIFDRRFEPYLGDLRQSGVEVHARSVFLQGLVFRDPYGLPKNLTKAGEHILKLNHLSYSSGIPVAAICLNFILLNDLVDAVIVGVDGLKQLKENIESLALLERTRGMYRQLEEVSVADEDILLPYRWN